MLGVLELSVPDAEGSGCFSAPVCPFTACGGSASALQTDGSVRLRAGLCRRRVSNPGYPVVQSLYRGDHKGLAQVDVKNNIQVS